MNYYIKIICRLLFAILILYISQSIKAQENTKYLIKLPNRNYIPGVGIDPELLNSVNPDTSLFTHGIIQFYALPSRQLRAQLLAKRIVIGEYLGGNAYYAAFSGKLNLQGIQAAIRYVGRLTFSDRIDNQLFTGNIPEWVITENGQIKIIVFFYNEFSYTQTSSILLRYTEDFEYCANNNYYKLRLSREKILLLAREDWIRWIEPGPQNFAPLY